jgi:cellulose synthase/poly-beta-1,6-N-acetylglucosamine synthase-like glycosyltransferase
MPCKAAEPGLAANIEAMLRQDYINYFVVIVTDTHQDSAYAIASSILARNLSANAQILVAEPHVRASGKVAALLTALSKTRGQGEAYAFVDSDARIPSNWLTELVDPLIDGSVGATTGFRWYFPSQGRVWSHLEAAWNASGTNLLFNARYNFPWGVVWRLALKL